MDLTDTSNARKTITDNKARYNELRNMRRLKENLGWSWIMEDGGSRKTIKYLHRGTFRKMEDDGGGTKLGSEVKLLLGEEWRPRTGAGPGRGARGARGGVWTQSGNIYLYSKKCFSDRHELTC